MYFEVSVCCSIDAVCNLVVEAKGIAEVDEAFAKKVIEQNFDHRCLPENPCFVFVTRILDGPSFPPEKNSATPTLKIVKISSEESDWGDAYSVGQIFQVKAK